MQLSIASLGNPGATLPISGQLDLQHVTIGIQQPLTQPVIINGEAYNQADVLWLDLSIDGILSLTCDRCGEPFTEDFTFDVAYRLGADNDEIIAIPINNDTIDPTCAVAETLLLELPEYFFCGCDPAQDFESKGANAFAALSQLNLPEHNHEEEYNHGSTKE